VDAVAATMAATPAHVFLAMADGVLAFDSLAAAQACTMPALIVLADRPFVEPALAKLPANWRTGRVVGAGHFLQLVVPDQVNAMLDHYLALLELPDEDRREGVLAG
jgi:pimeloyl-ACP methyl ester carboxylesterase